MQYEDKSASGFTRRKAQKAIAANLTLLNPPKSVDASVLTALRQGRQTILRAPVTTVCGATVERDDLGCCIGIQIYDFKAVALATGCTGGPPETYTIEYTITWTPVPNTTASVEFQGVQAVVTPFTQTKPGYGTVLVRVVCGSIPTKCIFTLTAPNGVSKSVDFTSTPV